MASLFVKLFNNNINLGMSEQQQQRFNESILTHYPPHTHPTGVGVIVSELVGNIRFIPVQYEENIQHIYAFETNTSSFIFELKSANWSFVFSSCAEFTR